MNNQKQSTMIRPILRLIAANITPHYYVVDYKKYMHSHRPTNSLSYNLIEQVQIGQPNSSIHYILPKCQDCLNFIPRKNVDKLSLEYRSLAKCTLFANKCIGPDGSRFEYAEHCRADEKMCGKMAKLFIGK